MSERKLARDSTLNFKNRNKFKFPPSHQNICQETLEGHQRAIMGNMTVEQIYKDRVKFSTAVFEVASSSLVAMGVMVISYTIKSLSDEKGYLEALGMTRTAQVHA